MSKLTLASKWDAFQTLVVPASAGPVQRQEMRRAFYAGAEAVLQLMWGIGDKNVSEEQGMETISSWHEECQNFADAVRTGKA